MSDAICEDTQLFSLSQPDEPITCSSGCICMTGMPYICGESPQGTQLPTNPVATCKFRAVTFGREEAIANSWPDGQKPNTKAYQADKLANDSEVPKGNRNLDA